MFTKISSQSIFAQIYSQQTYFSSEYFCTALWAAHHLYDDDGDGGDDCDDNDGGNDHNDDVHTMMMI